MAKVVCPYCGEDYYLWPIVHTSIPRLVMGWLSNALKLGEPKAAKAILGYQCDICGKSFRWEGVSHA